MMYTDDIDGSRFEVWENPESKERMLAFEVFAYRNSHTWNPEETFSPVEFTLQLISK